MSLLIAQAGLLPGSIDAFAPLALIGLLAWREVRRASAGPGTLPADHWADRLIVPLLVLFSVIVVLELVRML
jgi:hypothetical protein